MKFLIHSNAPTIPTGYGVQCRQLADQLASAGHEVAVSCTYGHQGGVSWWESPSGHQVQLYPNGWITNSPDVIAAHAEHWFEGDPTAGWIITLLDVWCLADHPTLKDYQVAAWTPVDHMPCPPDVLRFFENTKAVPIAMSKFGQRMLAGAGLDPAYVPLTVDTEVYRETFELTVDGEQVSGRALFNVPEGAFVVGMVAMNKDYGDRKGFNEALRAFGRFWKDHQNAVLLMHTDQRGIAQGLDLRELAAHAAVPEHTIIWTDQYAYRLGLPSEMLAALYTCMDVFLSPSRGEGFCVPLVEAQACGVPVISSDFSAQPELVGAGWTVTGQLWWDPAQHSSYVVCYIADIVDKLNEAYDVLQTDEGRNLEAKAVEFAAHYDSRTVFADYWLPLLDQLVPPPPVERPKMDTVDVIVPLMRPDNLDRLMTSLGRRDEVHTIIVHDGLDVSGYPATSVDTRAEHTTYAEKVNVALDHSTADFVLVVGDDVEFTEGWFEAAREVSPWADVIGTNDSEEGRVRNPAVANGTHADHFLIRRSYIDDEGSSLDGPGVAMPTAYRHWFVDREVIELARARGVFTMADECRIIHHHPGYDGDEQARQADPVYMAAVESAEADERTWLSRAPLVEGYRITRRT